MSFILDALKKSETERQQQGGAEFSTVPAAVSARGVPRWTWVLIALLGVNVAVMLGFLLRPDAPPESTTMNSGERPVDQPARKPAAKEPPQTTDRFEDRLAEARESQADMTVAGASEPESTRDAASPPDEPIVRTDVPSMIELRADGRLQIPDLHLDIHVFSETPIERFVFINMSKRKEGDVLDEGPRVVEILVDGVLLEHQGQAFRLMRE